MRGSQARTAVHIGIDFDNTIVSYDALFHKVAVEQGAVPGETPRNKNAVRDYLRQAGREPVWTEMQGYVYGARMDEAAAYEGVLEFMRWARDAGLRLSIVSHKTRHPFMGPRYDLHAAARGWIEHHLLAGGRALIDPQRVHFELTKEEKLARVASAGCDWFIDDLPEILQAAAFPATARPLLFDPDGHHTALAALNRMATWREIRSHFESLCSPKS